MKEIKVLFEENESNKLVLPDFQRDFEWKTEVQKKLIASFFLSLPVGSLLILNGTKDDFATKKLCFPKGTVDPKEECAYLLDGQQRLSSLRSIFSDYFSDSTNWLENWNNIYKDLRNRWFVRVKPATGETDIFGWNNLQFNDLKKFEPGQIVDLFQIKTIYKTKTDNWFHPGYTPKDDNGEVLKGHRLNAHISRYSANEHIVPLYTIYGSLKNTKKALHTYVLEEIANQRIKELKAAVSDGELDIVELLEMVEPNIADLVDEGDESSIDMAWLRLSARWSERVNKFLTELMDTKMPIIELPSDEISRAIAIFESINRGGTPLDTFDLIVAKAAKNQVLGSLSQRILENLNKSVTLSNGIKQDLVGTKPIKFNSELFGTIEDNKISKTIKNQFLNLLSIISHSDNNCDNIKIDLIKKNMILELNHNQINDNAEVTLKALIRACMFLHYRCGIINIKAVPYELMLLPIAYVLREDTTWENNSKLAKIEYWYWASLFGGAYREGQNDKCIKDIKDLSAWISNGQNPFKHRADNVLKDSGYSSKDVLLMKDNEHNVPGAIKEGILQYILSKQPKDFLPNEVLYLNTWDIAEKKEFVYKKNTYNLVVENHHIFPLSNATKMGESSKLIRNDKNHVLNSPLNRTYISSTANKLISDTQVTSYLKYIDETSQWGHCLSTPVEQVYERQVNETDNQYYERVLKCRYEELYRELRTELDRLENI